jgi:protein translocase SEC61 complex gamma subunit
MAPTDVPQEGFLATAWRWQHRFDDRVAGITSGRIARVLKMARKPEPDEYRQSAIVVLVGMAVIGAFGFFTFLLMNALLSALGVA